MSRYKAVVFDMDGVLVDSEPLFLSALNLLLVEEGAIPLSERENRTLIGTTVEETWRRIREMRLLPRPLSYYLERYDRVVWKVLEREMSVQPGVRELLHALRDRGMLAAVASSSLRSWVDLKLGILGLRDAFDAVLGGDEVATGKPDPAIYLQVAQQLGLRPHECIAIEDSPPGISAAVAAGMFTVAVRTAFTWGLDISRADIVLDSLVQFDLDLLNGSVSHEVQETSGER